MIVGIKHVERHVELSTDLISDQAFKKDIETEFFKVFSDFEITPNSVNNPLLRFYFVSEFSSCWDTNQQYQSMGNAHYYNNTYKLNAHGASVVIDFNEVVPRIYYRLTNKKVSNTIYRFKNSSFSSYVETQINVFYYRVFLTFIQWSNIKEGCTFVHASSFVYNENAYLLSATSGIGKSSFLMAASRDSSFSFIADDLTVLNQAGNAFFLGRKLSVKPYHLNYFPWLKEVTKRKMRLLQKLQWALLSKYKRLGVGLAPSSLFPGRTSSNATVHKVFHLINHHENRFEAKSISSNELARICSSILQSEMFLGLELFNQLNYFRAGSKLSSSLKLDEETSSILNDVFDNIELEAVLVPYRSDPNELADFIKTRLA